MSEKNSVEDQQQKREEASDRISRKNGEREFSSPLFQILYLAKFLRLDHPGSKFLFLMKEKQRVFFLFLYKKRFQDPKDQSRVDKTGTQFFYYHARCSIEPRAR